jgi:hypothetical protein
VSDHPFLTKILLACSRGATRLFRNNTGQGWVGKSWRCPSTQQVTLHAGDVVVRNARPLHAGLVDGGADLIGWTTRTITPDDVGKRVALFTALEGKEGAGRLSSSQRTFLAAVQAAGGIAAEVRSVDEAVEAVLLQG